MCVCVYSRIIIIVESAVRGKRKEGEEKERKKERKKDLMTLERKKVVTAQKHTNFQFVFFLRCDFEEFLFTFQVCAPQRAEQKEREREREREEEEEKERARSLAHSPTLSH